MNKVFSWLFLLVFYIGTIALPGMAYAAPSVGAVGVTSTTKIINNIINKTPGITTYTTSGAGVAVSASGSAGLANGLSIPIAASALVTPGRFGGIAAAAIRGGGWIGIAGLVVPWIADQYGIKVCPPPAFFCVPGPDEAVDPSTGGFWVQEPSGPIFGKTHSAACANWQKAKNILGTVAYHPSGCSVNGSFRVTVTYTEPTCPPNTRKVKQTDGTFNCVVDGPSVPASQPQIGTAVESAVAANPDRMGQMYEAITAAGIPVFTAADPVTVQSPPVTMPPQQSVTTNTLPDGSTDRVVTTTETKVTPNIQGGTIGNTTVSYPTTTTTTTTTTNNVTNITHTTTNVTNVVTPAAPPIQQPDAPPPMNDPSKPEPVKPTEFPKDYNKEVTQKSILEALTAPITATAPTGDDQLTNIGTKITEGNTAITGITEQSSGLKGWLPSIQTTSCSNPSVPNPITGSLVQVNICDSVNLFAKFFSSVICVLALYGCIREVQSAMKA